MALKIPVLDDRKYESILEDARKRIPIYTQDWTDHNIHDPGITFLELLVWIAEMQIYHLDQITEKHYLKFLKLLGFTPRPQCCASVDLTIQPKDGLIIPENEQIETTDEAGTRLVFETSRKLAATGAKISRIICDYPGGREDNTEANKISGVYFLAFGTQAEKDSCMYVGFDTSPFVSTIETLDMVIKYYENNLPPPASHGDEAADVRISVEVVWQYCTDYDEWYREESWTDFQVEEDMTMMLSRGGVVVLKKPDDWSDDPGRIFNHEEPYCWIRCRVVRDGYEIPPQIDGLLTNTVNAVHRETIENEKLERLDDLDFDINTSTGLPNQRFGFSKTSIISARIIIDGAEWEEVEDFDGSCPHDTHYVLDRPEGEILFGNGINGKIPPAGQQIMAEIYYRGGGIEGNVKSNSAWKFNNETYSEISVINIAKAAGGADEESFVSVLLRLKKDLKIPYRGVTLEDYRYIATNTPGLRFGRAEAIISREITESGQDYHKIQVVVVPYSPGGKPEPSQGFIDTVWYHLERHRLITDQIEVKGPKYVGIGVGASVSIKPGYSEEGRRNSINEALKNFLNPLTGGEDKKGWPFGRTVYRSEIYSLIESVEGVECVLSVYLESTDGTADEEGNIQIDEDELVYSADHRITIMSREERCRGGV